MIKRCAVIAVIMLVVGYIIGMLITSAFSQPLDTIIKPIPSSPTPAPTNTLEQQLTNHLRIQELKNKLIQQEWQQRMFEDHLNYLNGCDPHTHRSPNGGSCP